MAFFPDAPGATSSTLGTVLGDEGVVPDVGLGRVVLDMVARSGVLDASLLAPSESGTSFESRCLGLPSEAVLESETVTASVTLTADVLIVRPMQTMGPGGGFVGSGLEPVRLDPGSSPALVGAAVREATEAAIRVSSSVLRPAGSWKGGHGRGTTTPLGGMATARRAAEGWTVTARIGDLSAPTVPSSTNVHLRPEASHDELGQAVVDALTRAAAGDLQPGEEDPAGGDRQVLVEADEHGLTIYPQAISGETGVWDVPAHPDVRTLSQQASTTDVGQAIALVADEVPEWSS